MPVGYDGLYVNVGGSFSDGEPGAPILRLIDQVSNGWSLRGGLSYPLIRSRSENFLVRATMDFRNNESDQLGALAIQDRLRVLRAGFDFDVADTWSGINQISFTYSKGIDALGATPNANPLASRFLGKTSFDKVELSISRRQSLTRRLSLRLAATGQASNEILLSPEECGVGGVGFSRAFDASEITGEDCVAGSAEFSWVPPISLKPVERFSLFGYLEGGYVWNRGSFITDRRDSVASAGFGSRFSLPWGISGEAELAFPLNRAVASEGNKDPRVFFRLTKSF